MTDYNDQCVICRNRGWQPWWPDERHGWTLDDFARSPCAMVPCTCNAGTYSWGRWPYAGTQYELLEAARQRAHQAHRQNVRREELMAEWWAGEGKDWSRNNADLTLGDYARRLGHRERKAVEG